MHVIALPTTPNKTQEYIDRILNHPTVQGKVIPFENGQREKRETKCLL